MRYLMIVLLCLSILPLGGCLVMYALTATEYRTYCKVEDTEANRLKVMHIVQSIVDQYALQERKKAGSSHSERFTILARYYHYAYSGYPSSAIDLVASVYDGKVTVNLYQSTLGSATKRYAEIQGSLVSGLKERFGEEVEVETEAGKMY